MNKFKCSILTTAFATGAMLLASVPAQAGSETGNFMVRVQATGVLTDDDITSMKSNVLGDLQAAGFDAEVSDEFIPTLTLTYFLTNNLAVELFCCFAEHQIDLKGAGALSGEIADTWIFPPALTLQYHFDPIGGFKPYVGAGVQYIHFFDEDTGNNTVLASSVDIDDAFGFTLQAGFDVSLGGGWYLNADVKKTWLDTEVTWHDAANIPGHTIKADADLDPLIVSAGIGYRFNLDDIFGRGEAAPLK